jgi:serine/threonine-protein kinase
MVDAADNSVREALPESSVDLDALRGTPYRMLRSIGRGGMGEVVEAEHRRLGKLLVVKLVHPELALPHAAERLRVEAQILSRLSHPNLVEVSDLGITKEGRPYLVMERLTGRTLLDEVIARRFLPPDEAVQIAADVLSALEAAHAAGIVHRDIKSENVFLHNASDSRGITRRVVKLLDFGVAKILAGDQTVEPSRFATEEGSVIGTPRFCSPEQAHGRSKIDHRADIYAVGGMLFTMVTGRRPFEQSGMFELMHAHLSEPPPVPSSVAPQPVPAALDAAILRALAKKPDDRFPSAAVMARALWDAIQGPAAFTPAFVSAPPGASPASPLGPSASPITTPVGANPAAPVAVVPAPSAVAAPPSLSPSTLASPSPIASPQAATPAQTPSRRAMHGTHVLDRDSFSAPPRSAGAPMSGTLPLDASSPLASPAAAAPALAAAVPAASPLPAAPPNVGAPPPSPAAFIPQPTTAPMPRMSRSQLPATAPGGYPAVNAHQAGPQAPQGVVSPGHAPGLAPLPVPPPQRPGPSPEAGFDRLRFALIFAGATLVIGIVTIILVRFVLHP